MLKQVNAEMVLVANLLFGRNGTTEETDRPMIYLLFDVTTVGKRGRKAMETTMVGETGAMTVTLNPKDSRIDLIRVTETNLSALHRWVEEKKRARSWQSKRTIFDITDAMDRQRKAHMMKRKLEHDKWAKEHLSRKPIPEEPVMAMGFHGNAVELKPGIKLTQ